MIKCFVVEEDGQTLAEYGPVLFFIALASIVILTLLGGKIRDAYFVRANTEIGQVGTST
ncbi:MAG: Flp family type IVb pilin [Armatimonadetes bacterium]|nr:Flp family type IVb pilin [Armatimonadota bacterium]PIU66464.1 MAG: Flp family type IVb pilin [Armatimonadetes bacterium CG07_land_8_20_14_0_80_59_28]PIY48721.1 MAG: Flp family type IVb pilin [Armatimonadetes bacterium CG_4_10_14_3_um_filter_59_10]